MMRKRQLLWQKTANCCDGAGQMVCSYPREDGVMVVPIRALVP